MQSRNCVPVPWLHHPVLPIAGCWHREHGPHFPPTSAADLSWVGTHRWSSRAGISPSSSPKTLAGAGGSKCAKQMCKRRKSGLQKTRRGSREQPAGTAPVRPAELHAPDKTPLQQGRAHQPTRARPHPPLVCLHAAGSRLALEIPADISRDQAEGFQQQNVHSAPPQPKERAFSLSHSRGEETSAISQPLY